MKLLRPSATIEAFTEDALAVIERAARTCYKSEGLIAPGSAQALIRKVIARGHESTLEHASATVRFVCDRGVTHELVRHRLAAFSQESTRYCDYSKDGSEGGGHVQFIIPPWVGLEPRVYASTRGYASMDELAWMQAMLVAEEFYQDLRAKGWSPQQARSVLPNSLKTEIVMTANMREWRHVFQLRCANAAHPQMREVMVPLLVEFRERWPVLFFDIAG